MGDVMKKLLQHSLSEDEIIRELIKKIRDLPENPNIEILGDKPKTFTMNIQDLEDNLSVEYYDFKSQYDLIISTFEGGSAKRTIEIINKVIENGYIEIPSRSNSRRFKVNPKVIEYLKGI